MSYWLVVIDVARADEPDPREVRFTMKRDPYPMHERPDMLFVTRLARIEAIAARSGRKVCGVWMQQQL